MRKLYVPAAALGLLAAAASRACAQIVYEPFGYTPATSIDNKVNPFNGKPWLQMTSNPSGDDDILTTAAGVNVGYPGLAPASGNAATWSGSGKSERLGFGGVFGSGTVYYSLAFQVTDLTGLTSQQFIAGFSPNAGTFLTQPQTVGTRLYLKPGTDPNTFNIGVSKNSNNAADIKFDTVDNFHLNTPIFIVGSYTIVDPTQVGTDDVATMWINPDPGSFGASAAPSQSVPPDPAILPAPVTGTDLANGAPSIGAFVLRQGNGVPAVQVDELRVDRSWAQVTPPPGVTWIADVDDAWSVGTRWSSNSPPDAVDAFVNFGSAINSPRTVTLDSSRLVRTLNFNNAQRYTIAASNGASLTFSGSGAMNVFAGSHTVAAPIVSNGDLEANVATGSTLTVSNDVAMNGNSFTKSGAGTLEMKNVRAARLTINGGTVKVLANGGNNGVSVVGGLEIAGTSGAWDAKLDLLDNDLVLHSSAAAKSNDLARTTDQIKSGFNLAGTLWAGNGITTSLGGNGAGNVHGLGVIDNNLTGTGFGAGPLYSTFSGQSVDANDILIKYTWFGDADLSGSITSNDYFQIDSGFLGNRSGWINGDFDYDGAVTSNDYFLIDNAFLTQGNMVLAPAASALPGVTGVPEPATLAILTLSAAVFPRRRRSIYTTADERR